MFSGSNFLEKAGVPPNVITDGMINAIDDWCSLYENHAPWLAVDPKSLGLPARIASEIATMVTIEMDMKVSGPEGSLRAAFIQDQLADVMDCIQQQTEYACAKGGLVFKPYPAGDHVEFEYVQADDFYPVSFNSKNEITSAVFATRKKAGNWYYTRIEKHTLEGKNYTIENSAYRSGQDSDIGQPCALSDVTEWADIQPVVGISPIDFPLFAYFKIPLGNTVDPKSPLGVSVYAKAHKAGLIEQADRQYQRLMWEYEGGEMAVDAAKDAFKSRAGIPQLPVGKERLFRMNDLDSAKQTEMLKTFSPQLRDASYTTGLQSVLRQVENICGLSYGTFADTTAVDARTATEIKMAKQRTYATVTSIQRSLQKALTHLAHAIDELATLYNLAPAGKYELAFVWDDSVIVDAEEERLRDMQEVRSGLMLDYEYRMKWYGEDEAKAKAVLAQATPPSDEEVLDFRKGN